MVVLDEKTLMLPPPPPYVEAGPLSPPPFPTQNRPPLTLSTLPPHLLLRIVYETFTEGRVEKQRKVLYWLTMSLRRVNRSVYIGEHASPCASAAGGESGPIPASEAPIQRTRSHISLPWWSHVARIAVVAS